MLGYIVLWFFAVLILIIVILLNIPLVVSLEYIAGKFEVMVKYLWFTLFPIQIKEKKESKKKLKQIKSRKNKRKKNKPAPSELTSSANKTATDNVPVTPPEMLENLDNSDESSKIKEKPKEKKEKKKSDLPDKIEQIKLLLKSSKKGLRRIVKGIYIDDIDVDFVVANEDAYEAAIAYGKVNIATYNTIAFLRTFFTISIIKVSIICEFNSNKSKYDGKCKVKFRPGTALLAAISIFCPYLINTKLKSKANANANPRAKPNSKFKSKSKPNSSSKENSKSRQQ